MIKTLLVDDERLARTELKRLLQAHEEIDVAAEAANGKDAITQLKAQDFDLVFLDIQMPGMTGLELAEVINPTVKFVFCTAFDQYAVDAFALNAVDYLVKPIDPDRLARCVQRIVEICDDEHQTLGYLPESHGVMMKFGDVNRIVRLFEIERFESVGNHAAVYTSHGKAFIHSSLAKIEARLNPQQFFKANRGDIIRIDAIDRIEPGIKTGTSSAFLRSGQEVEISRRQAQLLKQVFSSF
ncbi:MAG: LytR/AlgR family response regulator transcription factor [Aestuariibacter sp.]